MPSHKQSGAASRVICLITLFVTTCFFSTGFGAALVSGITYNFDRTLTGVAPVGPTPWLTATFSDAGANTVQLQLSAPGLTGNEFVGQWYFNLNPSLNPSSLVFAQIESSGAFANPSVLTGANAFKPDWDGKYDIMVNFGVSGDNSSRFSAGDTITFSITGIAGLTASDFLFANTPSAGHETLVAAANIQTVGETVVIDTPPPLNGPESVPEVASTAALLGLAMLTLEGGRRRLRILRG